MSMSQAEMRELMDAGLHNDTYHDKQDKLRARKEGWKVWGINADTARPYIEHRGFATEEDARAFITQHDMEEKWFVKEADPSDPDYYASGEKGYWASMSEEEYERYCELSDMGMVHD